MEQSHYSLQGIIRIVGLGQRMHASSLGSLSGVCNPCLPFDECRVAATFSHHKYLLITINAPLTHQPYKRSEGHSWHSEGAPFTLLGFIILTPRGYVLFLRSTHTISKP
jgi:hypothetical protein